MLTLAPDLLLEDLLGFLGGSFAGLFSGLLVRDEGTLLLPSALLTVTGDLCKVNQSTQCYTRCTNKLPTCLARQGACLG